MLWDAGQARIVREATEDFDRLVFGVRAGFVFALDEEAFRAWMRSKRERPAATDVDRLRARDRTIAMLGSMFPGKVKVG